MHRVVLTSLLAACALQFAAPAWALYKVVGPDGRVTYTDRAPTDGPVKTLKADGTEAAPQGLPYELQKVANQYPVKLFTGAKCVPCDAARQMLKVRGIPFVEKTVTTADDARAYSKQEGTDQLPSVRIGQKQLLGFGMAEWTSYLDAAGYPDKSALPLNYQWPAPAPLVPFEGKPEAASAPTPAPAPTAPAPRPANGTPPGFRF